MPSLRVPVWHPDLQLRRNPAKSACKSDRQLFMKRLIVGIQRCQRRDLWRAFITGSARCHRYRNASGNERAARQTLSLETDFPCAKCRRYDVTHDARDIAASISSGSFQTLGMVILPCSIKTLSGIVHSYTDGLLTRAADVVLKSVARWCSACVKRHCT